MKSLLNHVKDYILPQYPTFSSLFVIYGNDTQDNLVSFINKSMKSLKKKIRQSPLSPLTLSKFQISAMKEVEDLENIESDDEIGMKKKSIVDELKDTTDLFSFNINVTPIKTESKEKIEYVEDVPEEFPFPPATPPSTTTTPSSSTNLSPFDILFPLPPTSSPPNEPPPQQLQQQISFDDSSNKVIDYSPIKIRSKSIDDEKLTVENSKDSIPSLSMREISNEEDCNNNDEDNDDDSENEIDEIPLLTVEEIFQHEFFQNIIRVFIIIYYFILYLDYYKLG